MVLTLYSSENPYLSLANNFSTCEEKLIMAIGAWLAPAKQKQIMIECNNYSHGKSLHYGT